MSWTNEQIIFLRENVGKRTHKDISIFLNKSKRTISSKVKEIGLTGVDLRKKNQFKKIYSVDESFFDKITPLSSYYAGLIASDGCIKGNTFSFTQSLPRKYVVELFMKYLNFNGKIYNAKNKKGYNSFTITISSKKIKESLEKNFGIISNKSLILKRPNLSDINCKLSFIVGLIDGDGCVGLYNLKKSIKKLLIISLCGTFDIVNWFKETLNEFNIYCVNPIQLTNNNTWGIKISGIKAIKFFKLIKNLEIPKMGSKWDILYGLDEDIYLTNYREKNNRGENGRYCKSN